MYEQFRLRAEGVGAEVQRLATMAAAGEFVREFMQREGGSAVCASAGLQVELAKPGAAAIPGLSFDVTREASANAHIGITGMEWALADTGSLVADQKAVEQRLASTLPSIHIALIGSEKILPGKIDLFTRIDPRASRYIAFITGPSRTADIERVLTIGVHGPKRLIILFVDEMAGGAQ
ncbi:MAG: lactate utilization protein [Geobacteraceae bacterium]|nr:lactate utilization protein [Geobacteraceae bacterium]